MKTASTYRNSLILLAAICLIQWMAFFQDVNPTWDASFYYAYTRSLVFDGDLNIKNDLLLNYPTASDDFVAKGLDQVQTKAGRVDSPYAIGSAIIWAPWLGLLRLFHNLGGLLNINQGDPTGYEPFFTVGVGVLSALLAYLAFWFSYQIARKETDNFNSLVATITFLFATPLVYYQFKEPLYSHATAVFATGAVIFCWWKSYRQTPTFSQAVLLGGLIGLATLVRWQHIVFIILPLFSTVWWWYDLPSGQRHILWPRALTYLAVLFFFCGLVFSIQMAHWKVTYNSWFTIPQGQMYLDWRAPFWRSLLFSSFRGVLPWMPVAFFGFAGLLLLMKRNLRLALPLLIILLLDIYINGSVRDWFGGGGYGPRRLTSELVILIVGYATLISFLPARIRKPIAWLLATFFVVHQMLLLRYAIPGNIGGRVQSMYPTFEWTEERFIIFLSRITSSFPDIFQNPIDFFVHHRSLIDNFLDGQMPSVHILSFAVTLVFIICSWLFFFLLKKSNHISRWVSSLAPVLLITLVVIFDLFLLFRA